jgi:hypothetical protein
VQREFDALFSRCDITEPIGHSAERTAQAIGPEHASLMGGRVIKRAYAAVHVTRVW